jgi:hypothetical protein
LQAILLAWQAILPAWHQPKLRSGLRTLLAGGASSAQYLMIYQSLLSSPRAVPQCSHIHLHPAECCSSLSVNVSSTFIPEASQLAWEASPLCLTSEHITSTLCTRSFNQSETRISSWQNLYQCVWFVQGK